MDNAPVKRQLGISYNTARYRLNRLIMFDFAKRLGLDNCYRCGLKIESIDDFTVDHKERWLNVDPKLFWDMNNIAFSHQRCNSRVHIYNPGLRTRVQDSLARKP